MVRSEREFHAVQTLLRTGLSDYEVAHRSGVPRSTVQRWRRKDARRVSPALPGADWRPPIASTYCYLLGLYLGDGWVVTRGRSASLFFSINARYPGIIEEAIMAARRTFPRAPVHDHTRRPGCVVLRVSDPSLPFAFPQHGPARKHERAIELLAWQRALTRTCPTELLRGLIHSDGCRCINRFETRLPSGRVARYEYARYFFTNVSADIRKIFCEHCEQLGVRWTQSSGRNVSICAAQRRFAR